MEELQKKKVCLEYPFELLHTQHKVTLVMTWIPMALNLRDFMPISFLLVGLYVYFDPKTSSNEWHIGVKDPQIHPFTNVHKPTGQDQAIIDIQAS